MMLHQLCSLLIASVYWQHVASRHIVQQSFYPPYSDYSYTYSGPGPFHQSFQHHHSPFFSPPGTYFDQRQGILRPFPGGGVPVLVDYHKRCSDNFVGLKAHPDQQQYYYVCKPDCVIFGKCQNLQIFNATSSQCALHPPPEYVPTCTGVGRFPLFSDCHLYFKCEEDLQPKIYSCPMSMIFSPASKKCINGNKCTPTQISPQSSYIPEACATKFPPCFESGIFRSPSDCSLYYKCDLKKNGIYMQTRLKCAQGNFYDLRKKECLPSKEVACDCIQVAELVYPKPNSLPFQPAVYPAQFELDSMIDGQYPVEQTNDSVTETSSDCKTKTKEIVADSLSAATTTLTPFDVNNELMEQNDFESTILSDYIDLVERQGMGSKEEEDLTPLPIQLINSSEETTGIEGFESTVTKDNLSTVTAAKTEEITQRDTTIVSDQETTNELSVDTEKEELLGQNLENNETTTISSETEAKDDEKSTTIKETFPKSLEPLACENLIEDKNSPDADTQTKNPTQTQAKKCFTKLTEMTKTQNPPNSTTLTIDTITTTTHAPTVKLKITTENLISSPAITPIPEKINLEENLLDSALKLDTAGTTQSSEKTLTEIDQVTRQSRADNENPEAEHSTTTSQDTIQTVQTHLIHKNSVEQDISYEDLLESVITKKTKAELSQESIENVLPTLDDELTTIKRPSKALESVELQKTKQATNITTASQAVTTQSDSTTSSKELRLDLSTEQSTDMPMSTEDDESAVLDSEVAIENDTLQKSQQESVSINEKSVTVRQVDFSGEDLIPVQSKNFKLNEIEEENSVLEKGFDDDYTTVFADNEITTTSASTTPNRIFSEKEENNEIALFDRVTTIKRRQTSLDELIQTTTQISVIAEALTSLTLQTNDDQAEEIGTDKFSVLDSEIVIPDQTNNEEEEVSNNEITSAETNQTTSNSNQQSNQISHSATLTTFTNTTPIPTILTTANSKTITSEPSEKLTNSFVLHVRKEDLAPPQSTQGPSLAHKNVYYILKTKPVINNSSSNSSDSQENNIINSLVAATPAMDTDNREVPRLEIIAQQPIDIHFSICASTCDKDHKHTNKSASRKRAVLLKWFARKSKQTVGFETSNEINADAV